MALLNIMLLLTLFSTIFCQFVTLNVQQGDSISLECTNEATTKCSISNTLIGFIMDRGKSNDPRFSIQNPQSCQIEISNVTFEDSDIYNCSSDSHIAQFNLKVQKVPDKLLFIYDYLRVHNNTRREIHPANDTDTVLFQCIAQGADPVVKFLWYVDGEEKNANEDLTTNFKGLWNTTSKLNVHFPLNSEQKEKTVKCFATQFGYNNSNFLQGTFGREYPVDAVHLIDRKSSRILEENETREIICEANGLPAASEFVIKMYDEFEEDWVNVTRESSFNVTEPGVYWCGARNLLTPEFVMSNEIEFLGVEEIEGLSTLDDGDGNSTVSPNISDDQNSRLIIGLVIAFFLAVVSITLVIIYLRRNEVGCFKRRTGQYTLTL